MVFRCGVGKPDVGDRVADLHREVELGAREALRRVFEEPLGSRPFRHKVADQLGPGDRDPLDAFAVETEHQASLRRRRRVVQMDDGALRAVERLERALDLRLARLGEHLDRHVIGNQPLDDQLAREVVVGLRRRRKADFDFLVAHPHQEAEHPQLAVGVHRLDQRLVAVAQIHAAPDRRARDGARGPLAIGQRHGLDGAVLAHGIGLHRGSSFRNLGRQHSRPTVDDAGTAGKGGGFYLRAGRSRSSSRPPAREVSAGSAGRPSM